MLRKCNCYFFLFISLLLGPLLLVFMLRKCNCYPSLFISLLLGPLLLNTLLLPLEKSEGNTFCIDFPSFPTSSHF